MPGAFDGQSPEFGPMLDRALAEVEPEANLREAVSIARGRMAASSIMAMLQALCAINAPVLPSFDNPEEAA